MKNGLQNTENISEGTTRSRNPITSYLNISQQPEQAFGPCASYCLYLIWKQISKNSNMLELPTYRVEYLISK